MAFPKQQAFSQQPQGALLPRRGGSLIRSSLTAFWHAGSNFSDSVSGRAASFGGAAGDVTKVVGNYGRAVQLTGTTNLGRLRLNAPQSAVSPGAGDFTVAIQFNLRNASSAAFPALGRWSTGANPANCEWFLGAGANFAGTKVSFIAAVGAIAFEVDITDAWTANRIYTMFGRRNGTTIYVDRYEHATNTWLTNSRTDPSITTINTVPTLSTGVGEMEAGASLNTQLDAFWVGTWKRYLSDAEIRRVAMEPYMTIGSYGNIHMPVSTGSGLTEALSNAGS